MTTAYTSLLGLALPVTGELNGVWGDTVNDSITSLLDSAVAGTTTISSDADVTLTTTTGASNTSRQAIILWTAGGTVTRNITAPAQSKIYTVINKSSSTQSIVLRGAGPTTGVTIVQGESAVCAWNGSDFIKISNTAGSGTFTNLTVTGNTSLGDADTDTITQAASYVTGTQLKSAKTATNTLSLAAYDVDGTAYTNLITLTAGNTPTLALTSTGVGTINNMSIGATTASTGAFTTLSASSTVTLSGGTENGVAYLNGSKVLTTGSALTFNGTDFATTGTAAGLRLVASSTDAGGSVLQVDTTATAYGRVGGSTTMGYVAGAQSLWTISGSEQMRLTSTSLYTASTINVGIGTSSPTAKLTVSGNQSFVEKTAAYLGVDVATSAGNGGNLTVKAGAGNGAGNTAGTLYLGAGRGNASASNGSIVFGIAQATNTVGLDSTLMTLDASGNLGIGTSSPQAILDVSRDAEVLIQARCTGATGAGFLRFKNGGGNYYMGPDSSTGNRGFATGGAAYGLVISAESAYPICFGTNNLERARIDSSGNLGIGTTAPLGLLNIKGSNGQLVLNNGNSSGGVRLSAFNNAASANGYLAFEGYSSEYGRFDSSGNLGLGTTAPQNKLQVVTTTRPQFSVSYNGTTGLYLEDATNSSWKSWKLSTSFSNGSDLSFVQSTNTSGTPTWAATAAMILDASGNLLVGTTGLGTIGSSSGSTITASGAIYSASTGESIFSRRSTDGDLLLFRRDTTQVGSISVTTTATAYNTSSDYRLKNTIAPMTGALAKVALLKPCTYKWNADGSDGEGFIAHELAEVVPQCVTGEKDAVDADGKPQYQGIDTSFLVATLTAAIQEQQALITQLTDRITALEGA